MSTPAPRSPGGSRTQHSTPAPGIGALTMRGIEMSYSDKHGEFFGRVNEDGNVAVLHVADGSVATRLDQSVYAVGSDGSRSVRYEDPDGIVLSRTDAERIGLDIEL